MTCTCGQSHESFGQGDYPVILRPRVSAECLRWALAFAEHRDRLNSVQGVIEFRVQNKGTTHPVCTGKINSVISGDCFYTESRTHFDELRYDPSFKEMGFNRDDFHDVTYLNAVSFDGESTYQFANSNERGHVFAGLHSTARPRTGIDTFIFREPYRHNYWDQFFLAEALCRNGEEIALLTPDSPEIEKIGDYDCVRLSVAAGPRNDRVLIRAWFDLERGGLPLRMEHWLERYGIGPMLLESLDDVELVEVESNIFMPRSFKRTTYEFASNGAVLTEQVTTYQVDGISVNENVASEVFRSAIPNGATTWTEITDELIEGTWTGTERVPRGKQTRLEGYICSQVRIRCDISECSSGPTRPLRCLICNSIVIIVPCTVYPGQSCETTWLNCGTILALATSLAHAPTQSEQIAPVT